MPKNQFYKIYNMVNAQLKAIEDSLILIKISDESFKKSLSKRFITLLQDYNSRKNRYSHSFHLLRTIMTVGSLIVPAVLSVQYTQGNVTETNTTISNEVYWIVWTLSLFVTISNGILTLLKMDRKYYVLNTTFEHLLSEGWQYIGLTGNYSGSHTPGLFPSHENQYTYFFHMIERIRMKQIEEEYYRTNEQTQGSTDNSELNPKTPFQITKQRKSSNESSSLEVNGASANQNKEKEEQSSEKSNTHESV
jgi:hypothetical protein